MSSKQTSITTFENGVLKLADKPYPLQLEIMRDPARRKIICAGRRAGKTLLAAFIAVKALFEYKNVHIASTSQAQADVFWNQLRFKWLQVPIEKGLVEVNVKKNYFRYINPENRQQYGMITTKTGRNADTVRGTNFDILILDECAFLSDKVWQVASPALMDNDDNQVIFISSPHYRNWFFHNYQRAKQDKTGLWKAWNFPSHKNPHLSKKNLDDVAQDLTPEMYRQEILAEFLESDGTVFRNIDSVCVLPMREPYEGDFVFGVDIAKKDDYTVVSVMDTNSKEQVALYRFNGTTWAAIIAKIRQLHGLWKPFRILVEVNNVGDVIAEALTNEDLPIDKWITSGSTKQPLIEGLVLAFDKGTVKLLKDDTVISEFMSYEREVTASGRLLYAAPKGLHDDIVIATAISWQATVEAQMTRRPMEMWA